MRGGHERKILHSSEKTSRDKSRQKDETIAADLRTEGKRNFFVLSLWKEKNLKQKKMHFLFMKS